MKSRNKIYAPVILENHLKEGIVVKAIKDIPVHTLIAEYSGAVVVFDRDSMKLDDSLMEYATFDETELVIKPVCVI